MAGLFLPALCYRSVHEALFQLDLDSTAPYLADHCPGGTPLLATAMAIEALCGAAQSLLVGERIHGLTNVEVHDPCVVPRPGRRTAAIRVREAVNGDGLACSLFTPAPNGRDTLHASATVRRHASTASAALRHDGAPSIGTAAGVLGARIYEDFFHTGCYRVVDRAEWRADHLVARFNPRLPASHPGPEQRSLSTPQLVEFALQTAGLFELASSGRMRIPHRIGNIVLGDGDAGSASGPVHARAQRAIDGESLDAWVVDGAGQELVRVLGYETVPLPFVVELDRFDRLRDALRRGT